MIDQLEKMLLVLFVETEIIKCFMFNFIQDSFDSFFLISSSLSDLLSEILYKHKRVGFSLRSRLMSHRLLQIDPINEIFGHYRRCQEQKQKNSVGTKQ